VLAPELHATREAADRWVDHQPVEAFAGADPPVSLL
jgi:hypothetical protein